MNRLSFIIPVLLVTIYLLLSAGCANIASPTGGYKDTLPPELQKVSPADSSTGFTEKKIVFSFDEYVEVKDIQQNLIVSPLPKVNPEITYKLRTVTVKIKDTLEPNTTYAINFGSAIKDVNESNPLKDFTYVFSTGSTIDNHVLSGNVLLAATGLIDSTLIVMLHNSVDDSAVVNSRPRYFTRLDGKGNFRFQHLPAGTFSIYALQDEGGQFRYLSKSQIFGFTSEPITIGTANEPVTLYAYQEELPKPAAAAATPPRLNVSLKDKKEEAKDKRLQYTANLNSNQLDVLDDLVVTFAAPLMRLDSTKFLFTDEKFEPIRNYTLTKDSTQKKLTLKYTWKTGTPYNIIVQKGWAEDSTGKSVLRTDTLKFRTLKESDYGSVRVRIVNFDISKNPVLQLLQNGEIKFSYPFTSREFKTKLFKPGEYDIRILLDDNKNGKWDPGSFFGKRKPPEKAQTISRKLNVKVNWDNEVDITL